MLVLKYTKMKIIHIINPVIVPPSHGSYLHYAQPVTFESMRRAKFEAGKHNINVVLLAACFPEDKSIVPEYMTIAPYLSRSVMDIIPTTKKKLPFLQDIIDRLVSVDGDVYVYTNADIGVQPHFYISVADLLQRFESIMINRRQLPEFVGGKRLGVEDLPEIYSMKGIKHPGSDTFVWKKRIAKKINTGQGIIGMPPIAGILGKQLKEHSDNHRLFSDLFLTFHLGYDQWNIELMRQNADLVNYNWTQAHPEERKNPLLP